MKPFPSLLKTRLRLFVAPLGFALCSGVLSAATLSVTPSAISNQFAGMITLQIGGLTNGETVTIDKFLDANTNGVIDGGDLLGQRFELTDGQVSLIGGKTNINVPGDSNPAVSNITTLLNFESINLEHIAGSYLFKLSSPTARFAPVTNTFNITNTAYAQSFTGQVRSNGTATAVANAIVVLLGANNDGKFVSGTVANNSGNYTLKAAPGTYQLAAFKSNFVGDFTVPPVTLGAGVSVATNINAVPATQIISGRVADAGNTNTPLPGILMFLESTNGFFTLSFTDTNGNFNAPVTASEWKVGVNDSDVALHGYVRSGNNATVITSTGSVAGVSILLPKGTAMFYGSIKDDLGNPLPGFSFYGQDQDTYQYQSDGVSDANGNYAVVALAGNWYANLSDEDPRLTNYVFSGSLGTITLTNGQAVRQDFVLKLATNHITGYLKDNNDTPISGVHVYANANINGTNYQTAGAITDGSGNYSLNVANGDWNVGVNCCDDCDDGLSSIYQCPGYQNVNISNGNGVVNFIVQLCTGVEITTTDLADGEVGANYDVFLNAASCNNSFTWSLNSGSLPPGLQLNSGGEIFGTPTNSGTFNFSAHVIDGNSNATNKNLSITIIPALQVTTTNLPNGTQGVFYSTQLNASGGQPPYHWYLPGGTATLPPGTMSLSDDGILSGTPTAAGTYNFWVSVFDNTSPVVATQYLSLTINAGSSPLQVTTTSLPNGTNGAFYSQTIQASGGQLPYSWSIANYSADPPANLTLATNGVLSGTLATSGGPFYFDVAVTDGAASTVYQQLSLTIINPPLPPLVITNVSLPNGNVGADYSAQLGATGGQTPYGSWQLAIGSASLPAGLSLDFNSGLISGTPTTNKTSTFKVQTTDANFVTTNKILSITINPKPVLSAPAWLTNRFQMRLTGATGQNYTVQVSTNLISTDWISILITNSALTNSFNVADPSAIDSRRFYRVLIGP